MFSAISSYRALPRVRGREDYEQKWGRGVWREGGQWMVHITVLLDLSTTCNYPLLDVNTET